VKLPHVAPHPQAVRRDPVTGKKIPLEPPPDHLEAERHQFVLLALQRAIATKRPFDEQQVIEHARIDWQRRQRAARRRQQRTKRLDDLLNEPATPSRQPATDAMIDVPILLQHLSERERTLLAMLFLAGYSRLEVANAMRISTRVVDKTSQKAIAKLRIASR